jgi:hypothetical protein
MPPAPFLFFLMMRPMPLAFFLKCSPTTDLIFDGAFFDGAHRFPKYLRIPFAVSLFFHFPFSLPLVLAAEIVRASSVPPQYANDPRLH